MKAVLKYQEGGDLSLFLIDYTPFTGVQRLSTGATSTSPSASKGSDDDEEVKNNVGLKDLLGLLKDLKGLPTEVAAISLKAKGMFEDMMLLNNGKISTSQLVTTYLTLLRDIRIADENKKMYEEKRKKVDDAGGLDDPAMDALGRVFVQNINTGEVEIKTPSEYRNLLQSENEYIALTNSQLLSLRQYDPNFSFKNDIFNAVDNGIGMSQITSFIQSISEKIGTTKLLLEGYSIKKANQIVSGLLLLDEAAQQGMTIDGLYKLKLITSDQYKEAKMALGYIWATLPANAKNRLRVASAEMGNPDIDGGALALITTLISSGLDKTYEFSLDVVKNPNDSSSSSSSSDGSGGSSGNDKSDKTNPYINMLNEEGASYQRFHLNAGTLYSMSITGAVYGNLKDNNWNPIGNTSMANVLDAGLSGIVQNMYGISFGNRVIDPTDLNDIMYDGGGAMVVSLPAKIVNGVKVVDLEIVNEYKEAKNLYDLLRGDGPENPALLALILQDMGLDELLDVNGLPDKNRFGHFLVVSGYAVDKKHKFYQTNDGKPNEFIEDLKLDDALIELLQRSLSTDNNKSNYKIDSKNWYETNDVDTWRNEYDHVYRGNLYIPLTENEVAGHDAGKETTPYYLQHAQQERYNLLEKRRNASYITGADVLNSIL